MLRLERHTVGAPCWRTLTEVAWSTALILERNKKCRNCRQTERRMRWAYGKEGRKLTEEEDETKAPAGINWFWKELKDTSPQFQWFTALARSQRGWASATAGRNKIKWVYRSHPPICLQNCYLRTIHLTSWAPVTQRFILDAVRLE